MLFFLIYSAFYDSTSRYIKIFFTYVLSGEPSSGFPYSEYRVTIQVVGFFLAEQSSMGICSIGTRPRSVSFKKGTPKRKVQLLKLNLSLRKHLKFGTSLIWWNFFKSRFFTSLRSIESFQNWSYWKFINSKMPKISFFWEGVLSGSTVTVGEFFFFINRLPKKLSNFLSWYHNKYDTKKSLSFFV